MIVYCYGSRAKFDCLPQFLDFCKHYRELRSMGFPAATVAGALVSHNCDIAAATEACLAAQ